MKVKTSDIRSFSDELEGDFISTINTYMTDWPYTKKIDTALVEYWKSRDDFNPEHMLIGYEAGRPAAALHGQMIIGRAAVVHMLAVLPGKAQYGLELLRAFETMARRQGFDRLIGPHWASIAFYGGYVLGSEPYHPHWAVDATNAYVRAGLRISNTCVILTRDLAEPVEPEPNPTGYDIIEVTSPAEFSAQTFGFHAVKNGLKAAHCYARWYPHLLSPSGLTIGQIGNVTTEQNHRNHGLARKMVKLCLKRLQQLGAGEALIATGLDNTPALRAYENAGYQRRYNINEWSKKLE